KYITYILSHSNDKRAIVNDLLNSILVGLYLMTETEKQFNFATIQPIFTAVLPLIADFVLQSTANEEMTENNLHCSYWLLGKMSHQGAQLISKMRMHIKDKQRLLQKSTEQQANGACDALFAVYIKYYRRINLAKYELSRTNDQKPHSKLLSIFEYANRVQTLFARTRGEGGDCNELYEQIKIKARFLLTSVKESNLIPIINEGTTTNIEQENRLKLKRQSSRKEN
ncbi:unnamed protein product, partial [Didymodactylos carnosus]